MIQTIKAEIKSALEVIGYTVEPFYNWKDDYFQARNKPENYPVAFIFGGTQYTFTDGIVNEYDQTTTIGIKLVHYSSVTDYEPIFDTAKRDFMTMVTQNLRLGGCVNNWSINQMDIKALTEIELTSPSPCYCWDVITTVDFIENGVA